MSKLFFNIIFLTIFIFLKQTAEAQTFVQVSTLWQPTTSTTISKTFSSSSTSGNLIIVHLDWDNQSRTISSLTDTKGNTYHLISGPTNWNTTNNRGSLYYAYNITGGGTPITVTATLSGAPTSFFQIYITEYSGISTSNPLDQNSVGIGSVASESSGSKTTTATHELIFGLSIGSNGIIDEGSGFTLRTNANQNIVEDKSGSTIGSYAATFTNTNPGGNYWIAQMATFKSSTSLPIVLLSFNAELNKNNSVDITWTTATEINNDFFTAEKSADLVKFNTVAIVKGAGNSNEVLNYQSVDKNPSEGISYYRLKQTDYNGNSESFNPVPVDFKEVSEAEFNLFPNPTDGNIISILTAEANVGSNMAICIYDLYGRKITENSFIIENPFMDLYSVLSIPKLNSGLYIINGFINNKSYSLRFIVK